MLDNWSNNEGNAGYLAIFARNACVIVGFAAN